jgi:CheY-like chemotaxis protein
LDVLMPELDGYQALEHVRSNPLTLRHSPGIMVSALEYVETLNAGSLFDKLTARQARPRDAAFMSLPGGQQSARRSGKRSPTALRPRMLPGGVKWAATALVRRPTQE